MTFSILLGIVAFWLVFHSIPAILHRLNKSHNTLLPAPLLSHSHHAPSVVALAPTQLYRSDTTTLVLTPCHLRLSTTALNDLHDKITSYLASTDLRRRTLELIYDFGTIMGVLGMVGAFGCVVWTCWQLSWAISGASIQEGTVDISEISSVGAMKRARQDTIPSLAITESGNTSGLSSRSTVQMKLLIPGVTIPASHFIPLFLSLAVSQLIHEAGHFLCAALDNVSLHSVGVALTVVIPSFFTSVSASSTTTASGPSRARQALRAARLAASGPLHNLILYLLLMLPLSFTWGFFGYENVANWGRVVIAVEEGSSLDGFVFVKDVITGLDDYKFSDIAITNPQGDLWSDYLLNEDEVSGGGWCVNETWFTDQSSSCCVAPTSESVTSAACFTASFSGTPPRCIDPLPILTPIPSTHARCQYATASTGAKGRSDWQSCPDHELCVRPRVDQMLLRIVVSSPSDHDTSTKERVVLWHGPRAEVYEQLAVSDYLPRLLVLPPGLPDALGTFFSYMRMLTLSLFLFNLLPLPHLDGAQLLNALLDWHIASGARQHEVDRFQFGRGDEEDVEAAADARISGSLDVGKNGTGSGERDQDRSRYRRVVENTVKATAIGLVGLCGVLGAVATFKGTK